MYLRRSSRGDAPVSRSVDPGRVLKPRRVLQAAPAIAPASSFAPKLRVAGAAAVRPARAAAQRPAIEMAAAKKSVKDLSSAQLKGKKVRHHFGDSRASL
jgi:hypothetical protein